MRRIRHVAQDMSVNHSRLDILVSEKALHLPNVDAALKQMRGEAVSEGMDGCMFCDARLSLRILNGKLD